MIYAIRVSVTRFQKIEREKKLSFMITLFFLFLLYTVLRHTTLPETKYETKRYDKIEWNRYHPKQMSETSQQQTMKTKDILPTPVEPLATAEKIDLAQISEKFRLFNQPAKKRSQSEPKVNKKVTLSSDMNVDIHTNSDIMLLPFASSLPEHGTKGLPRAPHLKSYFNPKIQAKRSKAAVYEKPQPKYAYTQDVPEVSRKNTETLVISPIPLEEIPKDVHRIMPKIFVDLSKWMAGNRTELPGVVKKFMNYDSLDLASRVVFSFNNRQMEMFLLCRESILEIRICLLEKDRVSMLIDKGFKKRSHFLRIGNVNRKDNDILSFGTAREAPSEAKTQDFYLIFLSWWQSIEKNQS